MQFSTRNAFYLRVSNYRVIPLFLYLDERHVDWMEDRVLQLIIADMQPKMREILFTARSEKKHKVYVERGKGYQYCYFLRSTTRTEVVLLKDKTYSLRAPSPPAPAAAPITPSKRKAPNPRGSRARSRSQSLVSRSGGGEDDEDDITVKDEPQSPSPGNGNGAEDDEEERSEVGIKDWKPDVSVKYKGFGTSSLQLVLIVEPYPPLAASEYAPPSSRLSSRSASVVSSHSRSRSRQFANPRATGNGSGTAGAGGRASRYSSTSLSVALDQDPSSRNAPEPTSGNMRNASRSISSTPLPNSRRGGGVGSVTPALGGTGSSATPFGADADADAGGSRSRSERTPLFLPRDTPFGEDEDDEEEHEAYTEALREGRMRLPSVSRPAGEKRSSSSSSRSRSRSRRYEEDEEDEDDLDDIPDGMENIGARLVRSSQLEESVNRVQGGWEEMLAGEESAVLGKEEPED